MTKLYNIVIFLIIISYTAFSQDLPGGVSASDFEEEIEKPKPNLYAAGVLKGVTLNDHFGVDIGLRVAGMIDEQFSIGAGFYYLFTQSIKFDLPDTKSPPHLKLMYFGPEVDYTLPITSYLKVNAMSLFALGIANFSEYTSVDVANATSDNFFFLVEPGVGFKVSITQKLDIGLSCNYRQSLGVDFLNLNNSKLSGFVVSLSLIGYSQ